MATCCHRVSDTEARLIAIDSLVCNQPDSALSLLADINGDSLRGEERAYHALLTVQALYKADIPATSDTLIRRAWDYYRDHGSYDRRIRAMLYSGTVQEELGHPDSAMRWYKRTELESRPDDHYYRGYPSMKMGILYQQNYSLKQAIRHYREALANADSSMNNIAVFCIQQLAQLYLKDNLDSAKIFINQIDRYVQTTNDSSYMFANIFNKSMMWFYNEKYDSAKYYSLSAISLFNERAPYTTWYQLVISCLKLDAIDSADYYFSRMPNPTCLKDSMFYYEILQELNKSHGKWENALKYEKQSNNLSDEVLLNENDLALLQAEHQAQLEYESQRNRSKYLIIALIVMAVSLVILSLLFYRRKNKMRKHAEEQIVWLNNKFSEANTKIEELQNEKESLISHVEKMESQLVLSHKKNDKLKSIQTDAELMKMVNVQFKVAFQNCIQRLGEFASDYYERGEKATSFISQFKTEFDTCWKSGDFWTAMENHINASRNNAISKIKDAHPNISISELRLIMLIMLDFDPMAIAICMGYKNTSVLYSMKNKLKRKLDHHNHKTLEEYLASFT